jgi:hypothetical protein
MESKRAFTRKSKPSSSRRDIERKVLTFGHKEAFGSSALLQVRAAAGKGKHKDKLITSGMGLFFFT